MQMEAAGEVDGCRRNANRFGAVVTHCCDFVEPIDTDPYRIVSVECAYNYSAQYLDVPENVRANRSR